MNTTSPVCSPAWPRRLKGWVAQFCAFSLAWGSVAPAMAVIADSPLYLTSAIESNVMFILDDSGSMHWESMPDDVTFTEFMFPRAAGNYGAGDYGNNVMSFQSELPAGATERAYAAALRSNHVNKVYYNPAVTYRPWAKPVGMAFPTAVPAVNAAADTFPDADPTAAPHHPIRDTGSRNLTVDNTETARYCNPGCPVLPGLSTQTFHPATYFSYTGGANFSRASYLRVEIRPTTLLYVGEGRTSRTDCAQAAIATCTYAEEIQNFANWYTYYRSRVLASQSGIGRAFAGQGTDFRVGFGTINKGSTTVDGVANTGSIISGVRTFSGADREAFFSNLYGRAIPTSGTPLRRALDDAGQYFSRTDNLGPWANTPGTDDGTPTNQHLSCRQSYTILMTDGYWNGAAASTAGATANNDGIAGPTITGPGGATFTYTPASPFSDGRANTLADVAMYYWKRDLRTDLANQVPTNSLDVAFWQHMTTFGVGLGVTGSVNPATAFASIGTGTPVINWADPTPTASNAAKLDDLLHAAINGRGGFFSAADPDTFANELSAVLQNIQSRVSSSSAVASNSTRLTSSTHLYQALFNSADWTGRLKAFPLLSGGGIGPESWDAANNIPVAAARNIRTWNGVTGTNFLGAMGALTAAQVDYLRGDQSQEISNGGTMRNRSSRLGDIVNADPHFVHNEDFGYHGLPGAEGGGYASFLFNKASRIPMVYAAANDGMLHGFRAGDGVELLAYVPQTTRDDLALLTAPAYSHRYFVDGSPTAWDAYWGGAWRTVLVGSLGAGGKAVYALNVNTPDTFGNAHVLWEYDGNTPAEKDNLGHYMGEVTVARFADGRYWAVFGNGYESTAGNAVLYMVRVDNPSIVKMFNMGGGGSNGMSTPILIDVNDDRVIDYIYAGDLQGQLWKFDTTDADSSNWVSSYGAAPLFRARDGGGNPQPITSAPEVGLPPPGATGLMVYFGTGQYYAVGDNSTTSVQSMYGVLDIDGSSGASANAFTGANHRSALVGQTVTFEGMVGANRVRAISNNPVNYNPAPPATPARGWFMDLLQPPTPPGTARGERVITGPLLFGGKLLYQTITPSASPCDFGGASFLMQVDPATGGNLLAAGFDVDGDGQFSAADMIDIGGGVMAHVSGLDTGVGISGGFGKPIKAGDTAYVPIGGTSGRVGAPPIASGSIKPRATWRQIQ